MASRTDKRAYWAERYRTLRRIYERAAARGEIERDGDWDLYLDLLHAGSYFQRWAKGSEQTLAARYAQIDLLLAAFRRIRE